MTTSEGLFERIYAVVRKIPAGKVTTYGEVARAVGIRDVRKVGWALHQNPYEGDVPCHRVVNKDGKLAPNFAFDGPAEQRRRLQAEGVEFVDKMHVDLTRCGYEFEGSI
jgi:methylated-DNA-protein-cysteine methyltransferase-like protein